MFSKIPITNDFFSQKEFYAPLSKTGYLTPLQRKKLREKRKLELCDFEEESKHPKRIKFISSRKNEKRKKSAYSAKTSTPKVQCRILAVLSKTPENYKNKKFFKTPPTSRFTDANFSMPFVFTKSLTKFNKNVNLKRDNENSASKKNMNLNNFNSCIQLMTNSSTSCESNFNNSEPKPSVPSKIHTAFDFEWPADDLLLRQKKARLRCQESLSESHATSLNADESASENSSASVKVYPIFELAKRKNSLYFPGIERNDKYVMKFRKGPSKGDTEQMIIDAGQQEIGPKICNTCDMLYNVGQEEDENLHSSFHTMFLINLKFPGWKDENIIGEFWDGRVIMIQLNDQCYKLKKVEDVLLIANRDLGFPASGLPSKPDMTFVLFISSKKCVAGCVVAEPLSSGNKVLLYKNDSDANNDSVQFGNKTWRCGKWYSSSEGLPALCGVNRIWVSKKYRHCKVASRMLDCLRCNFIHGHVISLEEIAFTDPSTDGQQFAAAYTGTKNFLVYK